MKIPIFSAQTEWVIPTEFPDLRQVDEIAIDLETRDPDLIKKGSGAIIGNGEVIGIAVAKSIRMVSRSFKFNFNKNISQCNVRCMLDQGTGTKY
jgi:hypothetical protein